MPFIGEAIALCTVLCWTVSVQFFEAASREVGATPVNIIRIFVALILFSIFLYVRDGEIVPLHFPIRAWWYLSLSGVVGFFVGDIFLFKALVELGPRIAMLLHSLAAPTAAVIGWLLLNETYMLSQWVGILVTLAGVAIVLLERDENIASSREVMVRKVTGKGLLFGGIAMLGQAGGYVLSKAGMQIDGGYLDAFAATQIRAIAAFICFVVFFTLSHKWRNVKAACANRRALAFTTIGAFVGPFLGVSLSLQVLHFLSSGVAATYLSLVPICIIPFSILIYKEHVPIKSFGGAVVAIFGIYLLMS